MPKVSRDRIADRRPRPGRGPARGRRRLHGQLPDVPPGRRRDAAHARAARRPLPLPALGLRLQGQAHVHASPTTRRSSRPATRSTSRPATSRSPRPAPSTSSSAPPRSCRPSGEHAAEHAGDAERIARTATCETPPMTDVSTHLMFQDGSAREAVERYVELIPGSTITDVTGPTAPSNDPVLAGEQAVHRIQQPDSPRLRLRRRSRSSSRVTRRTKSTTSSPAEHRRIGDDAYRRLRIQPTLRLVHGRSRRLVADRMHLRRCGPVNLTLLSKPHEQGWDSGSVPESPA